MATVFEKQLEAVIAEYDEALRQSKYDDASDTLSKVEVRDLQTRCLEAIDRVAGRNSVYFKQADGIGKEKTHTWDHLAAQIGVARSLLSDLRNGFLQTLEELAHAEVFADFLEMAAHLVKAGYKDAGAVIAGSTLESHLRALASKNGLASSVAGVPKKADALNAELAKSTVYSKLDQKNVTAV